MGFANGWFMMILGCYLVLGFWGDLGEKLQKCKKRGKLGIIGLLCRSVGNPRRGVGVDPRRGVGVDPRRGVDLHQGVGYLVVARPMCQKWHPSGTPRRSKATPWRRPMSQRSSAMPQRSYCL